MAAWGGSGFRPEFLNVKKLRAIIPNAKMMAMTATATSIMMNHLKSDLEMVNPKIIECSPNRLTICNIVFILY